MCEVGPATAMRFSGTLATRVVSERSRAAEQTSHRPTNLANLHRSIGNGSVARVLTAAHLPSASSSTFAGSALTGTGQQAHDETPPAAPAAAGPAAAGPAAAPGPPAPAPVLHRLTIENRVAAFTFPISRTLRAVGHAHWVTIADSLP